MDEFVHSAQVDRYIQAIWCALFKIKINKKEISTNNAIKKND